MIIPSEFDSIRSYTAAEMPGVMARLLKDPEFSEVIDSRCGSLIRRFLFRKASRMKNAEEFQKKIILPLARILLVLRSKGLTGNFNELDPEYGEGLLFISNHRDIVLDSVFLDYFLLKDYRFSAEIAIGDNLMIKPWIEDFVRLNHGFLVRRSITSPEEMLKASTTLSRYIRFNINHDKPVWLAQREGRAKDSNDLTQRSVLKMLSISGDGDVISSLAGLHIVPLAISYEYDPCDWLKAMEFQLKRDDPGYRKTRLNDLLNMRTGIFGYKGHIHYQAAGCIDSLLDGIDRNQPRNFQLEEAARLIDNGIHRNYRIFPCNRIASDVLNGTRDFSEGYSEREKKSFMRYLDRQLSKIRIKNPDYEFLRTKMLEMYANPLMNKLKALEQ